MDSNWTLIGKADELLKEMEGTGFLKELEIEG